MSLDRYECKLPLDLQAVIIVFLDILGGILIDKLQLSPFCQTAALIPT